MSTRVDWRQAEKDYVTDASLSYQNIASNYGVSKKQVGVVAKRERWTERRREVHEKGMDEFFQNQAKHVASINSAHAKTFRRLRSIWELKIDTIIQKPDEFTSKQVQEVSSGIKTTIEMERRVLGLDEPVSGTMKLLETVGFAEAYLEARKVLEKQSQ